MTRGTVSVLILILLLMLAPILIGTGAYAQSSQSSATVRGSNSPGTESVGSVTQTDVDGRHGRPGGVERIQDPYNTAGAASAFGASAAAVNVQNPSGAGVAPQNNPYPYGVKPR